MYSHMKSQNNVGIIENKYNFDSLVITVVLQEKPENFFLKKTSLKLVEWCGKNQDVKE